MYGSRIFLVVSVFFGMLAVPLRDASSNLIVGTTVERGYWGRQPLRSWIAIANSTHRDSGRVNVYLRRANGDLLGPKSVRIPAQGHVYVSASDVAFNSPDAPLPRYFRGSWQVVWHDFAHRRQDLVAEVTSFTRRPLFLHPHPVPDLEDATPADVTTVPIRRPLWRIRGTGHSNGQTIIDAGSR